MKVSIVTWDASFRENFHTIESFSKQTYKDFEFIWVDYFQSSEGAVRAMSDYKNFMTIDLDHKKDENWHLGKCINAGVRKSAGELLIIPDGDIVVPENFIEEIVKQFDGADDLVVYHRRFDQDESDAMKSKNTSIDYLKQTTKLYNPTNYAGCLVLTKDMFERIGGYEEHEAFSGPGINGMETYIRLRNSGACIKWSDTKIYHPWHGLTGSSASSKIQKQKILEFTVKYPWLKPYAGILQSWVVHCRERHLECEASITNCENLIEKLPKGLQPYV